MRTIQDELRHLGASIRMPSLTERNLVELSDVLAQCEWVADRLSDLADEIDSANEQASARNYRRMAG